MRFVSPHHPESAGVFRNLTRNWRYFMKCTREGSNGTVSDNSAEWSGTKSVTGVSKRFRLARRPPKLVRVQRERVEEGSKAYLQNAQLPKSVLYMRYLLKLYRTRRRNQWEVMIDK